MSNGVKTLQDFLALAFDTERIGALVQKRLLRGRQTLAALVPLRGHLVSDGRFLMGYRAEITDGSPAGSTSLPLFLHHTAHCHTDWRERFERQTEPIPSGLVPPLKRHLLRVDEDVHLTAFPLDPALKQIEKLLRPGWALELFNRDLSDGNEITALSLDLVGYRPERRAVFRARAVNSKGEVTHHLIKASRRHAAERVWNLSSTLAPMIDQRRCRVVWPEAMSEETSLMRFKFIDGASLHDLAAQGVASSRHFKKAGELIANFHGSVPEDSEVPDEIPRFGMVEEIEILERWRRLFGRDHHPLHGQVAQVVDLLSESTDVDTGHVSLIHRDFYPKQIIVPPMGGKMALIDIDTVAVGPVPMDIGNMLAHLPLHLQFGASRHDLKRWRRAFLRGCAPAAPLDRAISLFELSSTARLLCLAAVSPPNSAVIKNLERRIRSLRQTLSEQ